MGKPKNDKPLKSRRTANSTPKSAAITQDSPKLSDESDILSDSFTSTVSIPRKTSLNSDSVYLCGSCNLVVSGELCASCEICQAWFHYACVNIPPDQAEFVNSPQIHWFCSKCNTSAQQLIDQLHVLTRKQDELDSELKTLVDNVKAEAKQQTKTTLTEVEASMEDRIYNKVIAKVEAENNQKLEEVKKSYAHVATPSDEQMKTMKTELKNEVIAFTQTLPTTTNKEQMFELFNEHSVERERIKARAANLILHNLPESRSVEEDISKVKDIIKDILKIADFEITNATRLGFYDRNKSRLFRITLSDVADKKKILSRATFLREVDENHPYASVYIRPDMTPKQVEASKNLQSQLRETRLQNQGTGKVFKISRGKIVEVQTQQQTPPLQPVAPNSL